MILYVDETEYPGFFIVAGLLVNNANDVNIAYKRFKKKINNFPISQNEKQKVFKEFKSVLLDRKYQKIKFRLLEEINTIENSIYFACYIKDKPDFTQEIKEKIYIDLLKKIVNSIDFDIDIIFDTFNKSDFENSIISEIHSFNNVIGICDKASETEYGLQFIDNICSVLRLSKSGKDTYGFYEIIKNNVFEV